MAKNKNWALIIPAIVPLLIAGYPVIFYYSGNASIIDITSLFKTLALHLLIAIVFYFLSLIILKFSPLPAAVIASVFLIAFHTYGMLADWLKSVDVVRIEHYSLLPIVIAILLYLSSYLLEIGSKTLKGIWTVLAIIFAFLNLFNITRIIPIEIKKNHDPKATGASISSTSMTSEQQWPDVYYLLFDEFASLQAMREYWGNPKVESFKTFLESTGFYVIEDSKAESIDTLHELATRLNFREYPMNADPTTVLFKDISNNRTLDFFKSKGYSTVVFEELTLAYPSAPTLIADVVYNSKEVSLSDVGALFDEFGMLVADRSMLVAFSRLYREDNPLFQQHQSMVTFTIDKITNLADIPIPKFVYSHLVFPHYPFMFNERGNILDTKAYYNWNYYLGNYNYSINVIQKMITRILEVSDPDNPPVIILQSDHGARNKLTAHTGSAILEDYPEDLMTEILFAYYFPDENYSNLTQTIDPINTIPLVINYIFGESISSE